MNFKILFFRNTAQMAHRCIFWPSLYQTLHHPTGKSLWENFGNRKRWYLMDTNFWNSPRSELLSRTAEIWSRKVQWRKQGENQTIHLFTIRYWTEELHWIKICTIGMQNIILFYVIEFWNYTNWEECHSLKASEITFRRKGWESAMDGTQTYQ